MRPENGTRKDTATNGPASPPQGGNPYVGDRMYMCPARPLDFEHTYAVVVTGDPPNFCGHLLLNVGGPQGMYFHVAGIYDYPRQMNCAGYRRYINETGKRELRRFRVRINNPEAAMQKLEELVAKKWIWGLLPHNCASFVEEIVEAGGSSADLYLNCPFLEVFD